MLFAELSVACIFISLLSPAWTMSHVHDPIHCGTKHCNGNGICEKPKHLSSQMDVKCKCIEGFVGEHCQIETVISRRCYSRLDETDEKNQIPGIGECPDGQWCLPDNFYCHFYDCPNSIGWCIQMARISVNSASDQLTASNNVLSNRLEQTYNEELFGKDQVPDFKEAERDADED
uniref:EGF-like domain-containing protein n=1 Tax=Plectus sambesii TaxID=2011161 RepID=A0A914XCC5_9BILA